MRALVPVASCVAVVLGWELVAHNSGAGWVQAVGDVLGAVLLVGLIAPAVVVWRARLAVVDNPADATVGLPLDVVASASTRLRVSPLSPSGPRSFVGPHRPPRSRSADGAPGAGGGLSPPGSGPTRDGAAEPLVVVAEHRGVHHRLVVEIASAAPFGLLWWRRTVVVDLARELSVSPRLGPPLDLRRGNDDGVGEGQERAPVLVGEPRGVRPYRPGDNRRWVHWPATAHRGELMVREMEGPTTAPVTVEVHLPSDPAAAERAAERALGTVVALLDRGTPVVLVTTEAAGRTAGPVGDRRSAGRRLARAVPDADPVELIALSPAGGRARA